MLLTIQQRFILDALRRLRCIRVGQLLILTREKFRPQGIEITERGVRAMLRQLCTINNDIRADEDMVYLSGVQPDSRRLEAVDVMLEISGGASEEFTCADAPPFLLRFAVGGTDLRFFAVGTLSGAGKEHLGRLARGSPGRVIWISDSGVPPDGLTLPPKHFFAARQSDGTHRFYGSAEP